MQGGGDEAARENWPLFDIVSDGVKDCWAVGDQGRVCRYDGERMAGTGCSYERQLALRSATFGF